MSWGGFHDQKLIESPARDGSVTDVTEKAQMAQTTLTIRVDPAVHKAVKHIAKVFNWKDSDVASTLLWVGLININQDLVPEDVKTQMLANIVGIVGNWGMLAVTNPEKAKADALKTLALLAKANKKQR